MSDLFTYISEELSPSQKERLYSEKAVCLCLFRVIFDVYEQQMLYRLIFQGESHVFTLKDVKDMLHVKAGSQLGKYDAMEAKKEQEMMGERFLQKLIKHDIALEIDATVLKQTPKLY